MSMYEQIRNTITDRSILPTELKYKFAGFTLMNFGGPGTSKSSLVNVAACSSVRSLTARRVGDENGMSSLEDILTVLSADPKLEGLAIILTTVKNYPYSSDIYSELLVRIMIEMVFQREEYELLEDENDRHEFILEMIEDVHEGLTNDKRAFDILSKDMVAGYFNRIAYCFSHLSVEELNDLYESGVNQMKYPPKRRGRAKKSNLTPVLREIIPSLLSNTDTKVQDYDGVHTDIELKVALDNIYELINNDMTEYVESFFSSFNVGKEYSLSEESNYLDSIEQYTHARILDVSKGVSQEDADFVDALFNNNNRRKISIEVAFDKIELRLPMANELQKLIQSNAQLSEALKVDGYPAFALVDCPGILHKESTEDEVQMALAKRFNDLQVDGILYFRPLTLDTTANKLETFFKSAFSEFQSDIPMSILFTHADVYFERELKKIRDDGEALNGSVFDKVSHNVVGDVKKNTQNYKNLASKKGRLSVIDGIPMAFKHSLVASKSFERVSDPYANFERILEGFVKWHEVFSNKIVFVPNKSAVKPIFTINKSELYDVVAVHMKKNMTKENMINPLRTNLLKNTLANNERLHGMTSRSAIYNQRNAWDFYSNLDEEYWNYKFKRISFVQRQALLSFVTDELISEVVDRALETPNGEIMDKERFSRELSYKVSRHEFVVELTYQQILKSLYEKPYYDNTNRFKDYVKDLKKCLLNSSDLTVYTNALRRVVSRAVHELVTKGIRVERI